MARLIFLALAASALAGCGRVWLPEAVERRAGEMVSREMLRSYPAVEGHPWAPFIEDAGRKLAAASERPGYAFSFRIVSSAEINAFASPDGQIIITTGLLKAAGRDHEAVAAVLSHEIGHVARRHGAEAIQSSVGLGTGVIVLFGMDGSLASAAAGLAAQLAVLGYGRDMELEADLCAVRYLARLGYPPETGMKFLRIIKEKEKEREEPAFVGYLRSHPPTEERLRYSEAYASGLAGGGKLKL